MRIKRQIPADLLFREDREYTEGNYFTIVYSENNRTFTDNSGNIIIKCFDLLGNIVYIRDNNGNDNETGFLDRISGGETVVDMEFGSVGKALSSVLCKLVKIISKTVVQNAVAYNNVVVRYYYDF